MRFSRWSWLALMLVVLGATPPCLGGRFQFHAIPLAKDALSADCTVHPVNILGDQRKEIVIVKHETLRIYAPGEQGLMLHQEIQLPAPQSASGKTYYGFARLDENAPSSLVLLTPEGVYYYPLQTDHLVAAPTLLLKKQMIQGETGGRKVQSFDFAIDLDRDGLDDLLLPEQNGFSIYHQVSPMKFEPVKLPHDPYKLANEFHLHQDYPEDAARAPCLSGTMRYRRGVEDLLLYDANGDSLLDLIYTTTVHGPNSKEDERYDVYLQRKAMVFDSDPIQSMEVPYESNADVTFRDLNLDGRLDAIVVKSNLDVVNPKTIVKFYIAGNQQYQLFTKETDRFVTKDPIGLVRIADFNNDKMIDFAMTFFSYQFGSVEDIVDLILANKVSFKLQFFLGQGPKGYAKQPSIEKELVLSMKADSFRGFPPFMLVDDMNGDGVMELVVRNEEENVQIYVSDGNFAYPKDPVTNVTIPGDANLDFEDINGDGLMDMIVSSAFKQSLMIYFSDAR